MDSNKTVSVGDKIFVAIHLVGNNQIKRQRLVKAVIAIADTSAFQFQISILFCPVRLAQQPLTNRSCSQK